MKKVYFGAMLIAATLWSACTEKEIIEKTSDSGVDSGEGFKIEASAQPLTKTGMDGELTVVWKKGDAISAWIAGDAEQANVPLNLAENSEGKTVGIFEGGLNCPSEQFSLYAVYPYDKSYSSNISELTLTYPTNVNQISDVSGYMPGFMTGKAALNPADGKYSLGFSYPSALLEFVIDGSGSIFSDNEILSLTFKANKSFVGEMKYDFETGKLLPVDETAGKELTVNFETGAKMDRAQYAWVAVAPADLTDADCSFLLKTCSGQEITFKINPSKPFAAQTKYTITFKEIDKWISTRKASAAGYDLVGANGGERANCYIVSKGGRYKFAADYVNRRKDIAFDKSTITDADWLWSSGSEALVGNISYGKSGAVYFDVKPGSAGNAVIAATDAAGGIVWSWHIWISPDENPLEPTHYTRNSAWLMSDRNLGASSNRAGGPESYGLYYQWGRKDPFPAANTAGSTIAGKEDSAFGNHTEEYVINKEKFASAKFQSVRNTNVGSDELTYTVRNPMSNIHFSNSKPGNDAGTDTWAYHLTLAEFQKLWSTDIKNKTIYDPCPAGWCVPTDPAYSWKNVNKFSIESDGTTAGYMFDASDGSEAAQGGSSWYPATGYRDAGQLKNLGYAGIYWTAAFSANTNTPYCLYFDSFKIQNTTQRPVIALNVRCMKM